MTSTETHSSGAGFVISEDLKSFEAILRSRTERSADDMVEFMSVDEKEIRHAAASVTQTLKRFAKAIVDSMEDPSSVNDFLRELDIKLIAKDHDWREIFAGIAEKGDGYEPHKRVLIVKYLQYLSTRKRLLAHVLARRMSLDDTGEHARYRQDAAMERRVREADDMLETATLGFTVPDEFERLQTGESIQLDVPENSTVDLMLAKHVYRLSASGGLKLISPDGNEQPLKEGRTMIGRHPECDVVTDRNFRDVSRVHVIVEWNQEPRVRVTDLSTLGTFIPTDAISQ